VLLLAERSKEVFGHGLEAAPLETALQFALDARQEHRLDLDLLKKAECLADDFTSAGVAACFVAGLQPGFLIFSENDFHSGIFIQMFSFRKADAAMTLRRPEA